MKSLFLRAAVCFFLLAITSLVLVSVVHAETAGLTVVRKWARNSETQPGKSSAEVRPGQAAVLSVMLENKSVDGRYLIDLELQNSEHKKVAQAFWDNVALTTGSTRDFSLYTPSNLPEGVYTMEVGVFNPHWQGLRDWYRIQYFEVRLFAGTVIMVDSAPLSFSVNQGETDEFAKTIVNNAAVSQDVTLDMEIYNDNGQRKAQRFYENVTLAPHSSMVVSMSLPKNLEQGKYYVTFGAFSPDWKTLRLWYGNVNNITVN